MKDDDDLGSIYALSPEIERQLTARDLRRKAQFIMVPGYWARHLYGATGRTYALALELLYLAWRRKGKSLTLSNKVVKEAGISRFSKWRALRDLERRGLLTVEERPDKSPIVHLNLMK